MDESERSLILISAKLTFVSWICSNFVYFGGVYHLFVQANRRWSICKKYSKSIRLDSYVSFRTFFLQRQTVPSQKRSRETVLACSERTREGDGAFVSVERERRNEGSGSTLVDPLFSFSRNYSFARSFSMLLLKTNQRQFLSCLCYFVMGI